MKHNTNTKTGTVAESKKIAKTLKSLSEDSKPNTENQLTVPSGLPAGTTKDKLQKAFPNDNIVVIWELLVFLATPGQYKPAGMRTKGEFCKRWGLSYDILYRIEQNPAFMKELRKLCQTIAGFDEFGDLVDCIKRAAKMGDVSAMRLWAEIVDFYKKRYFSDDKGGRPAGPQIIDESKTIIMGSEAELTTLMDALDTLQLARRKKQLVAVDEDA